MRNSVYGSLSYLSQSVFWGTLLLAAWSDWKYYRIPNRLIIFGIVSGIMSLVFQAADLEAGSKIPWLLLALSGFLVRGVAVLVLGIFLHSLGMIGAADLKLVALLAAWLGFSETIKILCVGFILGAVWSLQKMLRYGSAFQRFLRGRKGFLRKSFAHLTSDYGCF